jgi:hypothetical protein
MTLNLIDGQQQLNWDTIHYIHLDYGYKNICLKLALGSLIDWAYFTWPSASWHFCIFDGREFQDIKDIIKERQPPKTIPSLLTSMMTVLWSFLGDVKWMLQSSDITLTEYTVRSESRCALIKGVGSDVHKPYWVKTELNNYTFYRYCTSTAV